jgi:NTE family protein
MVIKKRNTKDHSQLKPPYWPCQAESGAEGVYCTTLIGQLQRNRLASRAFLKSSVHFIGETGNLCYNGTADLVMQGWGKSEEILMLLNLRRIPFFSELPETELRAISEQLRRERYLKGHAIFREGEEGDALYLIESGQVQVVTGPLDDEKILAYLGPGNFFGELALLLDEPRSATVRVVIDCEVWVLRKHDLQELLEDHPIITLQMSRELSRRLVETSRSPTQVEEYNLVVVVGPNVGKLAVSLARQTGQRVVLYDMGGLAFSRAEEKAVRAAGISVMDSQSTTYLRRGGLAETLGFLAEKFDWVLMSGSLQKREITSKALELADVGVLLGCEPEPWIVQSSRGKLWQSDTDQLSLDRLARRISRRIVGLALSSGGARGIAHIGVLRVLEEAGIPIDMISGTSAGSLFGSLYAAGLGFDRIVKFALGMKEMWQFKGGLWDIQIPPRSGLFWGRKATRYFDQLLDGRSFADLQIPMCIVAADILSGEEVIFDEGPVAQAIRASISMVGIAAPVQVGDRLLIDGGAVNPLPASVLAQRGANIIIGSSVIAGFREEARLKDASGHKNLNILDIVTRHMAIMEREIIKTRMGPVNVLIRPRIETFTAMDYDKARDLIRVGAEAAREMLPRVQALVAPQASSD